MRGGKKKEKKKLFVSMYDASRGVTTNIYPTQKVVWKSSTVHFLESGLGKVRASVWSLVLPASEIQIQFCQVRCSEWFLAEALFSSSDILFVLNS